MSDRPQIVLVHGAWADGSCWSGVIERLQADGFDVRAPQFPLTLAADVARLRQVLEFQEGPTLVVAHSYGGQIVTAGTDAANVVGLVYVAAFALDEGETAGAIYAQGPPSPALEHQFTDEHGFIWLSEDDFVNHFAADVEPTRARVMYAAQQPLSASVFDDVMGIPAWKSYPTWYPRRRARRGHPARRSATVRRADGCDHDRARLGPCRDGLPPAEVAELIETAAATVGAVKTT